MGRLTEKITLRERADLGPVLARADHRDNAIEVNAAVFYKLPPMVQEFVLCHEVCHLKHNEWDETRTQQLAARLFMDRATDAADREARQKFLSYLDGRDMSNFDIAAVLAIVGGAFSLGSSIWGVIKQRNAGWYSWDNATQRSNIDTMLRQAFEQSRRSRTRSAADFLWEQLRNYTFKDSTLEDFLSRSDNSWVRSAISRYEAAYGFGLEQVTPIDLTAYPLLIVAVGALLGFAIYKIIKNRKK